MGGARLGVNGNNVSSVTWFLSLLGLAELCPFSGYLTQHHLLASSHSTVLH